MSEKISPLFVLSLCVFFSMLGVGIISPILPIYAQDLGATLSQIGLISAAWHISSLIFTAPVGRYSDRSSKKRVILLGFLVNLIASLLYAFSWNFISLASVRFIHGFGYAMLTPIAMAYGAELAPRGREGQYMGSLMLSMTAGFALGPMLGGFVRDIASKNTTFYIVSGFIGLGLILAFLMLPDTKDESKTEGVSTSFRKVLSNKSIVTAIFFSLMLNLGVGSIFNFLAMFLSMPKSQGGPGLSFSAIGIVFSIPFIFSAIVQRESGKLADRMNKTILIVASGVIGTISIILFPNMNSLIGLILVLSFFWGGVSLGMPAIRALAVLEGRESGQGTVMSVVQTSENIGNILGPLLAGVVAEILGLRYVFYMCSLIISIATIGYYILSRLTIQNNMKIE